MNCYVEDCFLCTVEIAELLVRAHEGKMEIRNIFKGSVVRL